MICKQYLHLGSKHSISPFILGPTMPHSFFKFSGTSGGEQTNPASMISMVCI